MTATQARARALRGPLAVAGAAAAAAAILHFRDPHIPGSYGLCPFYELTGWWCPGCGGLRALHHLTDGDLVTALHSNVAVVGLVATLVVLWGGWIWSLLHEHATTRLPRIPMPAAIALIGALTLFAVVRNTPWGHFLAPV